MRLFSNSTTDPGTIIMFDLHSGHEQTLTNPNGKFAWGGFTIDCLSTAKTLLAFGVGIHEAVKYQHEFMSEVVSQFSIKAGWSIWDWEIEAWVLEKMKSANPQRG